NRFEWSCIWGRRKSDAWIIRSWWSFGIWWRRFTRLSFIGRYFSRRLPVHWKKSGGRRFRTITLKRIGAIEMKLSILDQAPISSGQTAKEALNATVELGQHAERLGYERFWVAEHHDLYGLASPNPAVMLGIIGAQTEKIRIGAGAVLLPYYKPFHVAETYNLLETLYPER